MDQALFKQLMASTPAPVTIVTTHINGKGHGATVSSFASLSLAPPLVSIALIEGSALLSKIRAAGKFGVNLLSHRQEELALTFASRSENRFSGVNWNTFDGLPTFPGISSFAACDLYEEVKGGDHVLLFGKVTAAQVNDIPPLVYSARKFGTNSKLISDRVPSIHDAITACAV